jgi:hypothetical protein
MKYKYSIKDKLLQLPVTEYKDLRRNIPKAIGKTIRTFDRYCNIKEDEFGDIPALDLDIIATFLKCTANDLKNYSISPRQFNDRIVGS